MHRVAKPPSLQLRCLLKRGGTERRGGRRTERRRNTDRKGSERRRPIRCSRPINLETIGTFHWKVARHRGLLSRDDGKKMDGRRASWSAKKSRRLWGEGGLFWCVTAKKRCVARCRARHATARARGTMQNAVRARSSPL